MGPFLKTNYLIFIAIGMLFFQFCDNKQHDKETLTASLDSNLVKPEYMDKANLPVIFKEDIIIEKLNPYAINNLAIILLRNIDDTNDSLRLKYFQNASEYFNIALNRAGDLKIPEVVTVQILKNAQNSISPYYIAEPGNNLLLSELIEINISALKWK